MDIKTAVPPRCLDILRVFPVQIIGFMVKRLVSFDHRHHIDEVPVTAGALDMRPWRMFDLDNGTGVEAAG